MNVRVVTVLIFVLILVGGLFVFFMNEQNTKRLTSVISPTISSEKTVTTGTTLPDAVTVKSNDNRVSFKYPESWHIMDVTPASGKGEFGPIMQSWVVQSYPITAVGAAGTFPENSARINIEIQSGGGNLPIEDLVDCSGKTVTCEKVGINGEQFIRSEAVLNTGMSSITVATFYDSKVMRASALVPTGSEQSLYITTVNTILNSFTFSDNAPVSN